MSQTSLFIRLKEVIFLVWTHNQARIESNSGLENESTERGGGQRETDRHTQSSRERRRGREREGTNFKCKSPELMVWAYMTE